MAKTQTVLPEITPGTSILILNAVEHLEFAFMMADARYETASCAGDPLEILDAMAESRSRLRALFQDAKALQREFENIEAATVVHLERQWAEEDA